MRLSPIPTPSAWNPHAHALVSDGVFTPEGKFLPLPSLDTSAVMEVFRRLLLKSLHQAERLSEEFMRNLLSWSHPGFSAFAGPPVEAGQIRPLECQARYITRPAMAMDSLKQQPDGTLTLQTPPTLAPAPPPSRWIPWNGFTGSPLTYQIPASIREVYMEIIATAPESE
jgi:hypothetical protein